MSSSPTQAFVEHRALLWGLAYRMLGTAADADDVVQDTFMRLERSPPDDLDAPLRPWLVRVAMNLARDQLRRRTTREYVGPWLPAPIDTADGPGAELPDERSVGPDARYSLLESLSFGFLLAAEKLTPPQRAVMVLRDVFGRSVRETADALDLTETNVRVTHHRARETMRAWEDRQRRRLDVPHEQVIAAMQRFFAAIAAGDVQAAEAALAHDVTVMSDGAGEFFASRRPFSGSSKVANFYLKISRTYGAITGVVFRTINGQPAVEVLRNATGPNEAPRTVMLLELNDEGRIVAIRSVLASAKLETLAPA